MRAPIPESEGRLAGHVALSAVQVFFGLFPLFGLWALRDPRGFEPLALAAWRMLFGAAALGLAAALVHGRAALPRARDLPWFLACALFGVVLNQVLFLFGLERSTSTNAGLVMCLIPVFTFAIAALVRQERFSALRGAGLAIALAGASLLFWAQEPQFRREYAVGNLLMAVNALSYSIYLVLSRPLARRYPPLATIAWVYILSLPSLILIAPGRDLAPEGTSARAWLSLAYVLVFPTALAYLLNVFALSRLRASTTAVYIYLQPLISGLAGALAFGERPTRGMLGAAALIFAGIWLVARRAPARASPHASTPASIGKPAEAAALEPAQRSGPPLGAPIHGDPERP